MRWRIPPGQSFLWDAYGPDVLVFDSASGSTHLLNAAAAEAVEALANAPIGLGADEIRSAVAAALSVRREDVSPDELSQLLAHLENLGLVDREDHADGADHDQ
jgi:PqqD family protein of HPr-rel-A system